MQSLSKALSSLLLFALFGGWPTFATAKSNGATASEARRDLEEIIEEMNGVDVATSDRPSRDIDDVEYSEVFGEEEYESDDSDEDQDIIVIEERTPSSDDNDWDEGDEGYGDDYEPLFETGRGRSEFAVFGATSLGGDCGSYRAERLSPHYRPFIAGIQVGDESGFLRVSRAVLRQQYWPSAKERVEYKSQFWYVLAGPVYSNGVLEAATGLGAFAAVDRKLIDLYDSPIDRRARRAPPAAAEAFQEEARSMGLVAHLRGGARLLETGIGDLKVSVLYETFLAGTATGTFKPHQLRATRPALELMWVDTF